MIQISSPFIFFPLHLEPDAVVSVHLSSPLDLECAIHDFVPRIAVPLHAFPAAVLAVQVGILIDFVVVVWLFGFLGLVGCLDRSLLFWFVYRLWNKSIYIYQKNNGIYFSICKIVTNLLQICKFHKYIKNALHLLMIKNTFKKS